MTNLLRVYFRINNFIARICQIVACLGVAFAILALTVSAVERFFFGFGYALLNDLPPVLMPWVIFPMMGVLLRADNHITVDLLPTLISHTRQHALSIAVAAIVFCTSIWFLWGGMDALRFFMRLNQTTETGVRFPLWWIYLSFPVGFGLLAWFALERIVIGAVALSQDRLSATDTKGGSA